MLYIHKNYDVYLEWPQGIYLLEFAKTLDCINLLPHIKDWVRLAHVLFDMTLMTWNIPLQKRYLKDPFVFIVFNFKTLRSAIKLGYCKT